MIYFYLLYVRGGFFMVYERKVNYYELDGMQIVHHSNYIRFLEEARIFYLEKIGLPYSYIEQQGVMIPVLGVNVQYKSPAKFGEIICVEVSIVECNGVRMKIAYRITKKDTGELVLTGETTHCFTDTTMRPVSLKKYRPEMYETFEKYVTKK